MVVIRPLEASRSIDIGGVPDARVDDSIGRGLQQVGGAVSQHAQRLIEMKRQDDAFAQQQAFNRWNDDNSLEFAKAQEGMAASGEGFAASNAKSINERAEAFMRSVPPELQPKMQALVSTAVNQWGNKGVAAQIDRRNGWFRTGASGRVEKLEGQVFNNPSSLEAAKEDAFRNIDATGLPEAEKAELKRKAGDILTVAVGKRLVVGAEADPSSVRDAAARLGIPSAESGQAKRFLLSKTDKDGSHISGMKDGFAGKLANLMQSAPPEIQAGLGIYSGARSTERQAELWQAALVKYGSPEVARKWVAPPGKSNHNHGDAADLSFNGKSLKHAPQEVVSWVHNNADRFGLKFPLANENWHIEDSGTRGGKHAEGETGKNTATPQHQVQADPRFANLSLSQRLSLYDQIMSAAQRGQTAVDAQKKAAYDTQKGALQLGIQTGEVASDQQILQSSMTDSDKATLLSALRSRQGDQLTTAQAIAEFQNGALTVDPFSSDGKKKVDAIGDVIGKAVPQEQQQAAYEELVRQSGSVPQSVLNTIRAGAESQVAAEVESAMQQASRFAQVNPAALGRRDGGAEIQRKVDDFDYYVNTLNLKPNEAARRIVENNDPNKVRDRKALEPAAKEFRKTLEGVNLASMFNEGWTGFGRPNVGFTEGQAAGIAADYLAIAEEQFYATSGNAELAKSRSEQEMKRLYGTTEIGGSKTVMKYPPEKHWPAMPDASDPYGYAKDQLVKDLAEAFPDDALLNPAKNGSGYIGKVRGRSIDIKDEGGLDDFRSMVREDILQRVILVATPQTGNEVKANQMPGYTVMYKDELGNLQTLYGKQWRPDPSIVGAAKVEQQSQRLRRAGIFQATGQGVADYLAGGEIPMGAGSAWDNPEAQQTVKPVASTQTPTVQGDLKQQRSQLFQDAKNNGVLNGGVN